MPDRWGQHPLSIVCGGRGTTDRGNSGKQGGKEKDRGHDGDETSKFRVLFRERGL